jgi:hypothetical protein
MTLLNMSLQWRQVTCRRCGRSYQCTPEDDYYGTDASIPFPGPEGGVCFACLLILNGRDPETTPVRVVDENLRELDPRVLADRKSFEARA